MSEEKRNIGFDELDDVLGGVGIGKRPTTVKSSISRQVFCPSCGVLNLIRADIDSNKCMKCGAPIE